MYEIIRASLGLSLESYQRVGNINIMLADMAASYIALNAVYADRRSCEKALIEVLRSDDSHALRVALQAGGFMNIAPKIHNFLLLGSFDAEQAKNLFGADDADVRSYKSMLQKFIFTDSKSQHPKSKQLKLFMYVIEALEKSCRSHDTALAHNVSAKSVKALTVGLDYSKDDMQCLINLISSMIPRHMIEYIGMKNRMLYNDRVESFGKRLSAIILKNNIVNY